MEPDNTNPNSAGPAPDNAMPDLDSLQDDLSNISAMEAEASVEAPSSGAPSAPGASDAPAGGSPAEDSGQPSSSNPAAVDFTGEKPQIKEDADDEDDEPIEPAPPVPGSVGSGKSYDEYQQELAKNGGKPPKKFKLSSTTMLLGILAIVAIVVVVVVMIAMFGKPKDTSASEPARITKKINSITLTCERDFIEEEVKNLPAGALSASQKYVAHYTDRKLIDLSQTTEMKYDTASAVDAAAEELIDRYYYSVGDSVGDPFVSSYPKTGKTLTITHFAEPDQIAPNTAHLLDLEVDGQKVLTSLGDLQSTYTAKGFTCKTK